MDAQYVADRSQATTTGDLLLLMARKRPKARAADAARAKSKSDTPTGPRPEASEPPQTPRQAKRETSPPSHGPWRGFLKSPVVQAIGVIGAIIGLIQAPGIIRGAWLSQLPIAIELRAYQQGEDGLEPLERVARQDMGTFDGAMVNHPLRIPVRLAVRNAESNALDVELVETRVALPLRLFSSDAQAFSASSRQGRRSLGLLPPGEAFQPIGGVDTLEPPIRTQVIGWLHIRQDGLPEFRPWLATDNGIESADTLICPLEVTLHCKGRPTHTSRIAFVVEPMYRLLWSSPSDSVGPNDADTQVFAALGRRKGIIEDSWTARDPGTKRVVNYSIERLGSSGYLCVRVSGTLRVVYVSDMPSRSISRQLVDRSGDGGADLCIRYNDLERPIMFTWTSSVLMFNDDSHAEVRALMKQSAVRAGQPNAYSWSE